MFSEKAPYIITVLVAALAWLLTHISDRLLATPLLLYTVQDLSSQGRQVQYFTFKNITRDKHFTEISLVLTAAADGRITQGAVIPVQPASEGNKPFNIEDRTFDFTLPELQPGWQIEISVDYTGSAPPSLRLSSPGKTVYAVMPSIETWLVEHEFWVLMGLIFAALLGLGIVSILPRKNRATSYD